MASLLLLGGDAAAPNAILRGGCNCTHGMGWMVGRYGDEEVILFLQILTKQAIQK
jgi:hypothetical protein